jgi:hypothetical protein
MNMSETPEKKKASSVAYMPTLERLKAVGGSEICFSEGRKMVHSAAFWIKSVQSNL